MSVSHNSSSRSTNNELATMSASLSCSSSLEHDNETLRGKIRQLREENARFVASNHTLLGDVESLRFELHKATNRLQNMEEQITRYRTAVAEINSLQETIEQERQTVKQEKSLYKQHVEELTSQVQSNEQLICKLQAELQEVSSNKKRAEDDRDMALDSAEQIQKAYEQFQRHVQECMQASQQRIECATQDRDRLKSELESCSTELQKIRSEMRQLSKNYSTECDTRQELEQLNTALREQLLQSNTRAEKLDLRLNQYQLLERENSELKLTVEQQRVRLDRYQEEIGESRAQLGQLEDLAQRLQKSMTVGKVHATQIPCKHHPNDDDHRSYLVCRECENSSRGPVEQRTSSPNTTFELKSKVTQQDIDLRNTKTELERTVAELAKAKSEIQSLISGACLDSARSNISTSATNYSSKNIAKVSELELSLTQLEDERERLLKTITNLECRLADVEASKAASDAELVQRGLQLELVRQEVAELSEKEASHVRDLRKKSLQMTALENQLDDKVSEVSALIARCRGLENELQKLTAELRRVRDDRDEQARTAAENAATCAEMRRIHDNQCSELESSAAALAEQRRDLEVAFARADSRVVELQNSLQEMTSRASSLQQELMQHHVSSERKIAALEDKLQQSTDLLGRTEAELTACRAELNATAEQLISSESQTLGLRANLQETEKLELQLKTADRLIEEKDQLLAELRTALESEKDKHQLSVMKQTEQECEIVRLLAQIAQLEQQLQQKAVEYSNELETAERKLHDMCTELEGRNEEIEQMRSAVHGIQLERSRAVEDIGSQLKAAKRDLKKERKEREQLLREIEDLRAEVDLSVAACEEKDAKLKGLFDRLNNLESEVHSAVAERTALLAEIERLKLANVEDRSRQQEERDRDVRNVCSELDDVRSSLKSCEDALKVKQMEVDSLNVALQERQWELQQRVAQLTQLDMAMKDRSNDWDERLSRLETALKNSRFETEQRCHQIKQLEEHVSSLMSALKEKSSQVLQLDQQNRKQAIDLHVQARGRAELERTLAELRRDHGQATSANREAEEQLAASRSRLEELQRELSETRQELASTSAEHDRLARDLADAVALLQSKEAEHTKLVQQLTNVSEERSRCVTETERDLRAAADRYLTELGDMRRRATATQAESAQLQQQLLESGERQAALVAELRRMAQQLSSAQMELDASRAIASAQRETVLVREAEIARLEMRVSLLQQQMSVHQHQSFVGRTPAFVPLAAGVNAVPDSANSTTYQQFSAPAAAGPFRCPPGDRTVADGPAGGEQNGRLRSNSCADSSSGARQPSRNFVIDDDDDDGNVGENPDSLEAMWRQLQVTGNSFLVNDSASLNTNFNNSTARDATDADAGDANRVVSRTQAADVPSSRPANKTSNVFEEKARIQNRIKALIGYREPAKKTKPKVLGKTPVSQFGASSGGVSGSHGSNVKTKLNAPCSVGPGRTKADRDVDAMNLSELSTAVFHYEPISNRPDH